MATTTAKVFSTVIKDLKDQAAESVKQLNNTSGGKWEKWSGDPVLANYQAFWSMFDRQELLSMYKDALESGKGTKADVIAAELQSSFVASMQRGTNMRVQQTRIQSITDAMARRNSQANSTFDALHVNLVQQLTGESENNSANIP